MLLEEFSTIFDRPEKVKKLREYILDLAIKGKLVKQDENDESADILLNKIKVNNEELKLKGRYNKQRKIKDSIDAEKVYGKLPNNWKWCLLDDVVPYITDYQANGSFSTLKSNVKTYSEEEYAILVRLKDLRLDIKNNDLIYTDKSGYEFLSKSHLYGGEILIANVGAGVGTSMIMPNINKKATIAPNMFIIELSKYINKDYFLYFLNTKLYKDEILNKASATGQPKMNKNEFRSLTFSLPPLNEQKRIVEKLDYLMEFCDKLEAHLEKKVKFGSLSAKSVLNSVSNCSSYEELEEALRFIIENFKDLTLSDGAVKELKNAILSLAVRGKLVPQDESDEPASVLLERIREDKESFVKAKRIKKDKSLPEIGDTERLFDIPKTWIWDRLPNITIFQEGPGILAKDFREKGIPLIRLSGMKTNVVSLEGCNYLDEEMVSEKWAHFKLDIGDIVVSSSASMGKVAIVDESTVGCIPYTGLIRFKMLGGLNDKYFIYFMQSPEYIGQINAQKSGTTIKHYGPTHLKKMIMPLPPVNEQKRIVEKVEKLMQLCDELELRIEKSKKYSEKLMESILKNNLKA